jgi:hypothetical protein
LAMALDLLHALHETPGLTFHRAGGRLGLAPTPPEGARLTLARYKGALLQALEDGEGVEARALLSSPLRLAALLAHALGVEAPLVLTLYAREGDEPRRYLVPLGNLTAYSAWASKNSPPPWRVHLSPTTGGWALDLRGGWEVALEARMGGTALLLLYPEGGLRAYLQAAGEALVPPEGLRVWRRGTSPFTARGWEETPAYLRGVAHVGR